MLKNIKARTSLAYKIKKAQAKNGISKQNKTILLIVIIAIGYLVLNQIDQEPKTEAKEKIQEIQEIQEIEDTPIEVIETPEITGGDIIEEGFEEAPIEPVEAKNDYIIHENIYKAAKENDIDIDWIIKECERVGVNPEVILNTIYKESTFNPKATNSTGNSAGIDRGILMFNSVYKAYVLDECAFDWKCAVTTMVEEVVAKHNIKHWLGSKKVLSQGFEVYLKDRK